MAFIDLGKLKFNWRGDWQNSSTYEVDDVVYHNSQTWVASADIAAAQNEPQANPNWDLMAAGLNFRGVYNSATTYYLHDLVTYGSALYVLEDIGQDASQTGQDPGGSSAASQNWKVMTPAPDANVLHASGDMVYRNNLNNTARLVITEQVGKGITVQEQPLESYTSRAFTYEENGDYGNSINTPGSIPAVTYTFTTKNQRAENYILSGEDREGVFTNKAERTIYVNIGDTITFNNTATHTDHPMAIRVSNGGSSVSTGTYTGEGTATVTWDTTNVAAGTYFYQCTNHTGMVGQIVVQDTTNRLGSSSGNGTINVCRGKTYTITFSGNLSNGQTYDLYTTAGGHSTANDSVTAAEGNSAFTSTTNSGVAWTTGNTVTITFTPNETTPNTVYIGNRNSSMTNNLIINVNDVAYVPSWGTAAATSSGAGDNREFKHWQDWYGGDSANDNTASSYGVVTTSNTRDPGEDVKVSDSAVGAQERRVQRSSSVTWTVPDGVEKVRITCIGGGGGGGSYNTSYRGGEGGGGGAFASGEFNVSAGEQLIITPGIGGRGNRGGTGTNGGTTSVTATSTYGGSSHISVSAEGGGGGWQGHAGNGKAGNEITVSGSDLVSGTMIRSVGGSGGYGAQSGPGWPHVGHCAGGGGSAGSMFGDGYQGGSSGSGQVAGIHYGNCGGAGIGGVGGAGICNYSPSDYGQAAGGGGGGSYGSGEGGHGGYHPNPTSYINDYGQGGKGGRGVMENNHMITGWTTHETGNRGEFNADHSVRPLLGVYDGATDSGTVGYRTDAAFYQTLCGGRYGDGEAAHPSTSADFTLNRTDKDLSVYGTYHNTDTGVINRPAKSFNGVLGRLWGGGGAGGARLHYNCYSCSGGSGGSGAGGGGSYGYSTSGYGSGSTTRGDGDNMTYWDPVNLAYRYGDNYTMKENGHPGRINTGTDFHVIYNSHSWTSAGAGCGGHGGALGGGGGGNYGGQQGGNGGIGGGGGGGSNNYSPGNRYGFGGNGGPGYVLIEWK